MREYAQRLCQLAWRDLALGELDPYTTAEKLPMRCFDGLYMLALLTRGFGFDEQGAQITFAEQVGRGTPDWPLGVAFEGAATQQARSSSQAVRHAGLYFLAMLAFALLLFRGGACLRWLSFHLKVRRLLFGGKHRGWQPLLAPPVESDALSDADSCADPSEQHAMLKRYGYGSSGSSDAELSRAAGMA